MVQALESKENRLKSRNYHLLMGFPSEAPDGEVWSTRVSVTPLSAKEKLAGIVYKEATAFFNLFLLFLKTLFYSARLKC